ncbi:MULTISPECIES: transaldolase family protein [unclassified Luteococcus]|uniref:transaldolase family protein n=1 Tax=unclassified Luteococcus TaxID=2639923 RepID=UPI00313CC1DE
MTTLAPLGFYIDCAEQTVSEQWLPTGIFSGVTSNPTLLRDAGVRLDDVAPLYQRLHELGAQEIFFQTWGTDAEALYGNAHRLREAAPEAVIKVPATAIGAQATARLHAEQIPVLMTAVYSAKQALIAAALEVEYIAPYFNRMFMAGRDAAAEIAHMTRAIPQDGTGPLVVAASIKSAEHMITMTDLGVRRFTISPDVISDLFGDPLAARAVDVFEEHMAGLL